jgi:multiple sugar transport system permease protein
MAGQWALGRRTVKERRLSPMRRREEITGYLFASPIIVGLIALATYPFLASIYYSFNDYNVIQPPYWTGLRNYHDLLNDHLFWLSLANTAIYSAVSIPLGLVLGLGLAILLKQKLRSIGFFRALAYLPSVVPTVAGTILWLWILNPQYGVINNLLGGLGFTGPDWLNDPLWTKPALILMSLWGIGPTAIIFLAGLQDIPESLYEPAEIDGAGRLASFRHITLPLITPTLFFNLVLGIIGALQVFNQAFIWGTAGSGSNSNAGGPENSILMYVVYIYQTAFQNFQMGYASAMSLILFVVILALTLVVMWSGKHWVYYEGATPK